ncbi:IclR family transcriptional regulator [Yersinia frederiksenii]|uniref:HTH-type transcriptional repressor AllR n=3 Tax=Yersinia frederiksenii TaxID=29484 RepID=A0A380PST6_YERFR|nr:IclR family transcriptional regulator [Yersinia frederiksenii]ATM94797.1 IclR family transcriptional regulator [Yersinia frederiksenii]EEQ13417.1 Transcriptional regulator [Yersinia frederiksenii ATCC 33641]KGA48757.1 winged helix DNA-binding domain protein [Yersinia frederiksenii ATCC 33641]MDN0121421.1 IclR family transcriptional regulator [Yersinia frederiksenii]CND19147.1 IclR family transcriptional regulator [Yersinia frederiksenii]
MKNIHMPTARVLNIIEVISSTDDGINLTQLSLKTGINKGTIHPILKTLVEYNYINFDKTNNLYFLGISCSTLSRSFFEKTFWLKMINQEMQGIVNSCNEVCQMGILDRGEVLYIDKIQSDQAVQLVSNIGTRLPATLSALGKAMLCDFTDEQIKELYPNGFISLTPNSAADISELREQFNQVIKKGYAIDNREINEETICYAVSLKQRGKTIAAISVSIPYFRASEEKVKQVIDVLIDAKQRIENSLDNLQDIKLNNSVS